MSNESLFARLERMPVPILPTMVGAATLSNVYAGLGFEWLRHITMWCATLVLLAHLCKIVRYPSAVLKEYNNVIPASLYAGLTMLTMILGSYYYTWAPAFGKAMWFAGIILHMVHILVFTWRNVVRARSADTFVPSWFVTYNGILVSCVVGGVMREPALLRLIAYYGIAVYAILMPLIIWRLIRYSLKAPMLHTLAIVLAPCSLCTVAYLNITAQPNTGMVYALYLCVLVSLVFVLCKLPRFFSVPFNPGFAGMTFPMAIGIVASMKTAEYFSANGNETLGYAIRQIGGIQIYVTTAIIAFVLFNFLRMLVKPVAAVSVTNRN